MRLVVAPGILLLDKSKFVAAEDQDIVRRLADGPDGKRRVCGGKGLKATEAYPPGFGPAIYEEFMATHGGSWWWGHLRC